MSDDPRIPKDFKVRQVILPPLRNSKPYWVKYQLMNRSEDPDRGGGLFRERCIGLLTPVPEGYVFSYATGARSSLAAKTNVEFIDAITIRDAKRIAMALYRLQRN